MNICGEFGCDDRQTNIQRGAFYSVRQGEANTTAEGGDRAWYKFIFDASRNWTGNTSWNGNHTHQISIGTTGNAQSFNITPPFYKLAFFVKVAQ